MDRSSLALTALLRSTLDKLKRTEEFSEDDPALRELKRLMVVIIADLETSKPRKSGERARSQASSVALDGEDRPQFRRRSFGGTRDATFPNGAG
jgi:hypothetical protein